MRRIFLILIVLGMSSCSGYKRPSSSPSKMASDTLCYRAETVNKSDRAAYKDEINRRNINCNSVLENDPLLNTQRY